MIPIQVQIRQFRNSSKGSRIQNREVIVREIQINQVFHSPKGSAFNLVDFAELKVKRHNLGGAWKAVGREVVEVVAADIEQLCFGGKATWDFGVPAALARGVLGLNLRRQVIKHGAMLDEDWCIITTTTPVINGLHRNDSHCSDSWLDT